MSEALRAQAAALPAAAGVYAFETDAGGALYVGKSVDLRARVLSHLRDPGNRRMLELATRITHERTAGEIGALLLEARRVKERRPLWNQRLKRTMELFTLRWDSGHLQAVPASEIDFAPGAGTYGLFRGRARALEGVRQLADAHGLCLTILGLERAAGGHGCFRSMIGRCAGACRGRESEAAHAERTGVALATLALRSWPYPGAVGLVESDAGLRQLHVIRNWCYLGSVERAEEASGLARVAPKFDADGYRILCRPLLERRAELVAL